MAAGLVLYTVIFGLIGEVPRQPILNETIRNVYFHVPMWFGMMALMISSLVYSIKYLRNGQIQDGTVTVTVSDARLRRALNVSVALLGILLTFPLWVIIAIG